MTNIHHTAIVEQGARISPTATIGAYTTIGKDVVIGGGTTVAKFCVIDGDTTIGQNNQIFSHAVLGTIPQDLKYDGERSRLTIGDNNKIREHTLINTGTKGSKNSTTVIGSGNLLMAHSHIGHDCVLGDNIVIANSCAIAGHVTLADNCIIGGMTAIHQFCLVGTYAMVGGGSILVQDMPPYCICEGNRAVVRGLNITGLRRNFAREDIGEIKKAYKQIFESSGQITDTAIQILQTTTNNHVKVLCQFVANTNRGIAFARKRR